MIHSLLLGLLGLDYSREDGNPLNYSTLPLTITFTPYTMAILQLYRLFILLTICSVYLGCSTTTTSIFTEGESKPQAVTYYTQLGLLYTQRNSFQQAHLYLNRALKIDKDSARVHNALGLLYQTEGKLGLAKKHFLEAIDNDDEYSQAYNNYGILLAEQDQYHDAFEQFKQAISNPEYTKLDIALYNYAQVALKINLLNNAKAKLKQAITLDKQNPLFYLMLSIVYSKEKSFVVAQKQLAIYQKIMQDKHQQYLDYSIWLASYIALNLKQKKKLAYYRRQLKNKYPNFDIKKAYKKYITDAG